MTIKSGQQLLTAFLAFGCFVPHLTASLKCAAIVAPHSSSQNVVLDDGPLPNLMDIQFLNQKVGWLAGRIGMFNTNDGGSTWSRVGPAIAVGENISPFVLRIITPILQLDFINETHGWVQRSDGILRTTDGGHTWELVAAAYQPQDQALHHLSFYDERNGWALRSGSVYHSRDGGRTWTKQTSVIEGRALKAASS